MRLIEARFSDHSIRRVPIDRIPVLQLDVSGTPQNWITPQTAAGLICTDDVAWSIGDTVIDLMGGFSRIHQSRSHLEIPAIIATRGKASSRMLEAVPPLTSSNAKLFARDRHMCAYCAQVFSSANLTRDHILPVSRKGKNVWMNVVAACRSCNHRKANRTPEEANMQLVYLPYEPNLFEDFILRQRNILADQMEYLLARVPDTSRIRTN